MMPFDTAVTYIASLLMAGMFGSFLVHIIDSKTNKVN